MNRLEEIIAHKWAEIGRRQRLRTMEELETAALAAPPPPSFAAALRRPPGTPVRLIAEIKRASPSRGALAAQLDVLHLAEIYRQNGAAAISVLTDSRFFSGSLADLHSVAALPDSPPVLCKDFILSPYQILEARAAGASAVLLIAACLTPADLMRLYDFTCQTGMDALIEVHSLPELEAALNCRPQVIGVNNRDLSSFEVNLQSSLNLIQHLPADMVRVAESGIHTAEDARQLAQAGFDALLVGEALVTSPDPGAKLRELLGRPA